ncbi:transposase [Methylosinus sporium]|uniref:Transposase n=1 Tax=Methylosinus sporium TaxID=428 RepID=A0A549T6V2_METSR|nr:transposase [Methylosinus sporium]
MHTHDDKLEPKAVRRLELITGTGRRRAWSREEKARIVEETLAPDAIVSQIARRHGVTPQQLFGWRREARRQAGADGPDGHSFARVVVDAASASAIATEHAMIEIVIGAALVRVPPNADAATLKMALRILKAVS